MSVRVIFANRSGFHAPIGVVLAWEERGSYLIIFWMKNRGRISETFTNYEAKDLLRKVVLMLQLESSWHGRSVDHVLTYSGRQIGVGSQKPSRITRQKTCCASESNTSKRLRITRQKTCCASESNTSVRVVFADRGGFESPIGVVLAWEERGSCLKILRMKIHGRISEILTNYEAKDLLRKNLYDLRGKRLVAQVSKTRRFALYLRTGVVLKLQLESSSHGRSVDHVLTHFGRQIAVSSPKPSRIMRKKTCCACESNTSVRVVFGNRSGFDAPIGVVLAREERGSCLNIFRMINRGRISETFTNYEAKHLLCKQKTCCASESKPSVRVVFANRSGFVAPIGVVLAWEKRGSCLNIFRMTNRDRILETITNYEAKDLLRKQKTCCTSESNTSVRVVFANRSGFDAPIAVVLAWEERRSRLNIFRMTNRGRIYERVTNYEAKDLLRKRQIADGSQKRSRITRQKTCCASQSNTSVRVVFANRSGFDAPIAVDMAWEERGSYINIFRTTNHGWIPETFTNYEAKDLLRKVVLMLQLESSWHGRSVDHVLTYSGRQTMVGIPKPSRITRQKTCCAINKIDVPIGVVMAWEKHGYCLKIFRTKIRGRISETLTNYEAKDLLRS
ncbi:uncharacterized protein G2W53_014294 [Senna tora]|uniref:Uncharacterized protein n=1 Tax=Senna tora TaxID=362788 RepID=A0A835C667_9FABA|nr:uncharacterized protein G2W53_014294 [Senna tora]